MEKETWDPKKHYRDENIAKSYDKERFNSISGKWGDHKEKKAFLRLLGKTPDIKNVMDVPCGTGRMTEVLLKKGYNVTGCDISDEMMQEAREKLSQYQNLEFKQTDILKLPFPDQSFDLVTCVRLFGHFPPKERIEILKEISRVSNKRIIVQYFHLSWLVKLKRFTKRMLGQYEGVHHPLNKEQLNKEISQAGLVEEARSWGQKYYSEEIFLLLKRL